MIAAVCDDESLFRQKMTDFLVKYKLSRRLHLDIVEFSSGKELLDYKYPCDILFLDYEMPTLNGMEVARELRRRKLLSCIIFVTSYPEYVFDSFEVNTFRYLLKPVDFNALESAIDAYIAERKAFEPITVNVDGELKTVKSEDVLYLEADGKYCNIITAGECVHSSKTLSQVLELLPSHRFYRTHKSYAVNLYCIESIKQNIATLINGQKILISRDKIAKFKNAYSDFIKHFQ